jgi:N-acetylneuraminic acid mutarotase
MVAAPTLGAMGAETATQRDGQGGDRPRRRAVLGFLRGLALIVGGVVLVVVAAAVVLALTTPSPRYAAGWAVLAELPEPRGEVASTVVERGGTPRLVVAGGLTGVTARTSSAVHELDVEAGTWRRLPDLPAPRHHPAAAAIDGDVYMAGGAPSVGDWTPQDTLWVLRDGAAAWEPLAPMPEGRDSHRMRVLDGRLHVVGGHGATSDVLIYDPEDDAWERGAPMPEPRHHLAVVVLDGGLWAVGGRDEDDRVLDAVHVWDPDTDTWREGPRLPQPVSAGVEGVLGGRIHLVGGEDPAVPGGSIVDEHLVLDPQVGTWRQAAPAPLGVHGAGGGVVGGRLVVTGGAARQGGLSVLAWTGFTAAYEPAEP